MLELLIALATAAVILSFAVPAFGRMAARNQVATTANRLLTAMGSTRLTAISRNVAATFCAGNASAGCHGDWSRGEWLAFVDADRDGRLDTGEALLVSERLEARTAIQLLGNGPFGSAVVFRPSGSARTPTGALAIGRLRICTEAQIDPNVTDLVLIGSGRVEAQPYDDPGGRCLEP